MEWIAPLIIGIGTVLMVILKGLFGIDKPQEESVVHAKPEVEVTHVTPATDRKKLDELGV